MLTDPVRKALESPTTYSILGGEYEIPTLQSSQYPGTELTLFPDALGLGSDRQPYAGTVINDIHMYLQVCNPNPKRHKHWFYTATTNQHASPYLLHR